ncbi:flagellar hook-length control protein FliK [Aestuariicella sp. G3-2]|uniref:flagellar hook-length control protein FliK n=1 Tax=Pseudomaricurvus albidus TaxID=2842452 RepID=UPI001C0C4BD6|nr:flagellar hook-length control protein FliK [Aestuariicella albida]MBU3071179.1 flagellar hook-length control protein FliK [Aestuariicella albida]
MNSHTSVSSAAADFWGKSPGASKQAISVRAEGAQAIASVSSDSKADFKRMLAQASEEKSAARKADERQNSEKQAQSRQLEEKRQTEQLQEARQLEKQQLEKQQLERQREEQQGLEEQEQERLYTSGDEVSDLYKKEDSSDSSPVLTGSDVNASKDEGGITENTALTEKAESQVESQPVDASLAAGKPDEPVEDPSLTPDTVVSDPFGARRQKGDSRVDDSGAQKLDVSEMTRPGSEPRQISLEELANAVAAFTGLGDVASGDASAAGSWNTRSFTGASGGAYGMPGGGLGGAFPGTDPQSFRNMMEANAGKAAAGDSPAQPSPISAAGVLPGAVVTPQQSSSVTRLQSLAVGQALDASEAGSKEGSAVELLREGGRNGDGGLFAAAQRSEGRSAAVSQGTVQFTVPTSKGELGQPEWHNTVAEKVAVMATKNLSSAEIQLDPPELGQLQVRVTLNQDQASVSFASQHAVVREALDQTAVRLREMFDAEGLNLVDVDVSDQSFQQQRQHHENSSAEGGVIGSEEVSAEPVMAQRSVGLVDHFV